MVNAESNYRMSKNLGMALALIAIVSFVWGVAIAYSIKPMEARIARLENRQDAFSSEFQKYLIDQTKNMAEIKIELIEIKRRLDQMRNSK
jgi:Tfp pilus assembly protein PilO